MNTVKIIHINSNQERKNNIINNLKIDYVFHEAIVDEDPVYGCGLSIQDIVKKYKHQPYIIFCEDDIRPTEHLTNDMLLECVDYIKKNNYDVFLGGLSFFNDLELLDKSSIGSYVSVGDFSSLHLTILNNTAYSHILNYRKENKHMDRYLGSIKTLKKISHVPFLATQIPSYSHLQKKDVNYDDLYNHMEQKIIKRIYIL